MEPSSPSAMSPSRHAHEGLMVETETLEARVPRPQSIPPTSRSPRLSTSPQLASARYVRQFHTFIEHQRRTFDEERALWNTERMELHEKIAQLEESLRRYRAIPTSQASSPMKGGNSASQSNRNSGNMQGKDASDHISPTTTGHEIWRGPKPDVKPTRTFSDPTTHFNKPGSHSRLPSIAEDTTCGRKDSSDMQPGFHRPSVSGAQIDKNLDGINFRVAQLPIKKIMTPQSPSPRASSPSQLSPRTMELPSSKLETPLDPYIKDAGHTPLARHTYIHGDGPSSEGSGATPSQPEVDRLPLEPHASFAKIPSERSNSYFPIVEDQLQPEKEESVDQEDESQSGIDESRDEDPELKGPLGLDNTKDGDNHFLHELDSKLLQAARSEAFSPSSPGFDTEGSPGKRREDFEQPEHEPQLRIKRSMNFGSAFGAKTCGKGI